MYIEKLKYNWLLGGNIRKLIFDDDFKKKYIGLRLMFKKILYIYHQTMKLNYNVIKLR